MTSNIGSHIIREGLENVMETDLDATSLMLEGQVIDLLKKTIRPEFFNRIDDVIMFRTLTSKDVRQIVKIQIRQLIEMFKSKDLDVEVAEPVIEHIAEVGHEVEFGARPLKRLIRKQIVNKLARMILKDKIKETEPIRIDKLEGEIIMFNRTKKREELMEN